MERPVSYQFYDANAIPWRKSSFAEGIEVKDLGTSDGRSMQLVRFAAGGLVRRCRYRDSRFTLPQSDRLRLSDRLHRLEKAPSSCR
jgi:hypothetical protein